jgi:hypothetical protein
MVRNIDINMDIDNDKDMDKDMDMVMDKINYAEIPNLSISCCTTRTGKFKSTLKKIAEDFLVIFNIFTNEKNDLYK